MKATGEIAKLCESWYSALSDSTRVEQSAHAEQFLKLLGWTTPTRLPQSIQPSVLTYLLRSCAQTSIAAHFVLPGHLEPPSSLVERGLDFCHTSRLLVSASRPLQVGYVFVTDLFRSYLYDIQSDELLLYANAPMEFNRHFVEVLDKADVERGSLEEVRRQPRSYVARQLREWCLRWCETIVADSGASKDTAFCAIDQLIVLRYLFAHDILRRSGWRFKKRFRDVVERAFSQDSTGCGTALISLLHDFWLDWKADLFEPQAALDQTLGKDEIAVPLIRELALLSNGKFTISSILESFNFGDAAEKALVRMVPDIDEERDLYLLKLTLEQVDEAQIEVDIVEEGYRSIFPWFDKLVKLYEDMDVRCEADRSTGVEEGQDLDLFGWSEKESARPEAVKDKFRYVVEHGLILYYRSPRQFRTARLMLYLHMISRYHQSKRRFTGFPRVSKALRERPTFLKTDRKWIYSPPVDPARDEWEVL